MFYVMFEINYVLHLNYTQFLDTFNLFKLRFRKGRLRRLGFFLLSRVLLFISLLGFLMFSAVGSAPLLLPLVEKKLSKSEVREESGDWLTLCPEGCRGGGEFLSWTHPPRH